jgi:hypothetical protein
LCEAGGEKRVPWEEIVRFFSGESLDTVPEAALPAQNAEIMF